MVGVVMAGIQNVPTLGFGILLTIAGGFVTTLLISTSRQRVACAHYAVVVPVLGWRPFLSGPLILGLDEAWLTARILPTFTFRLLKILAIEFVPRGAPCNPASQDNFAAAIPTMRATNGTSLIMRQSFRPRSVEMLNAAWDQRPAMYRFGRKNHFISPSAPRVTVTAGAGSGRR